MSVITIGGSEISVVMGLNRWKTPLRLWAEKTGKIETEPSQSEAAELGSELEDFVAKKFIKKTGIKVRRDAKKFVHPEHEFAIGHIDRRVEGRLEGLECKTCSTWKAKEWEGEDVPQEYILQCMWYMGITGWSKWYIAVLIGGQKFVWKALDFDKELFDKMIDAAKSFIEKNVKEDVPPIAMEDDTATLLRLHPQEKESVVVLQEASIDELIGDLQFVKSQIIEFEKQEEALKARIEQEIGDHEGIETLSFRVTWKSQVNKRVDSQKLKDDGLYEKYLKASSTRVLRISRKIVDLSKS